MACSCSPFSIYLFRYPFFVPEFIKTICCVRLSLADLFVTAFLVKVMVAYGFIACIERPLLDVWIRGLHELHGLAADTQVLFIRIDIDDPQLQMLMIDWNEAKTANDLVIQQDRIVMGLLHEQNMLVRLVMSGRALSVLLDVFCEAANSNLGELLCVRGDSLFEKNHRTHEIISSSSDYFEFGV